ncbi:MAG: hypothetical protein ABIW79_09010 [Gemmatimonas sp.]
MWADTLFALERGHLLRLALWGGLSVLVGTSLFAWLTIRRVSAPLLRHFAIQTVAWGTVDLLLCLWASRDLALRDYAGAQRLLNTLWLNLGLDAGYIAVGVTLAITAWRWGARAGGVGAGLGIIVQGVALLLLDLRLLYAIGPMQ